MTRHNVLIERPMALALAPVLLAQAAWAMARAPRLPEPEAPRTGVVGDGPPLRLLVVGDSSAAGVGAPTQDIALTGQLTTALSPHFRVHWQLVAKSGATTQDTRALLAEAAPGPVDVAVTALGVNDVKDGVRLEDWLAATRGLHDDLRTRVGAKQIIVSGLPCLAEFPALPKLLGRVLHDRALKFEAALCADLQSAQGRVRHLPFDLQMTPDAMAVDGFHPGPAIYREWARRVAGQILTRADFFPEAWT